MADTFLDMTAVYPYPTVLFGTHSIQRHTMKLRRLGISDFLLEFRKFQSQLASSKLCIYNTKIFLDLRLKFQVTLDYNFKFLILKT